MTDSAGEIVQRTRRRHGAVAGALAAGMVAMRDLFQRPRDEIAVIQEVESGVPPNIDQFGLQLAVWENDVEVPPLAPLPSSSKPRRGEPVV